MEFTLYGSLIFLCLYLVALTVRRIRFQRDRAGMKRAGDPEGRVVARVGEVSPGSVKKFWLICEKYRIDCFLVNWRGELRAYINSCRHMVTPLDFVRYQFFTEDGQHLVCLTHGALYEPDTGLCVDGPCKGLSLHALPVAVERDRVIVRCPKGDVSFLSEVAD